jgi:hypothetical protein
MSETAISAPDTNKTLVARDLRKATKRKRKQVAQIKSVKRGRPRKILPDAPEEIKYESGFCPDADRAWKLFVDGMSIPHISHHMKRSSQTVHKWMVARTAHLQEMNTPENQAKAVGIVADRYHRIWREAIERAESADEKGQGPAWMAIALKSTELISKVYGVGGETAEVSDLSTARRLTEIAERMKLIGAFAHPGLQRQALEAADVEVKPPRIPRVSIPKVEQPPQESPAEAVDGRFVVV